jgi:hypothetical protein
MSSIDEQRQEKIEIVGPKPNERRFMPALNAWATYTGDSWMVGMGAETVELPGSIAPETATLSFLSNVLGAAQLQRARAAFSDADALEALRSERSAQAVLGLYQPPPAEIGPPSAIATPAIEDPWETPPLSVPPLSVPHLGHSAPTPEDLEPVDLTPVDLQANDPDLQAMAWQDAQPVPRAHPQLQRHADGWYRQAPGAQAPGAQAPGAQAPGAQAPGAQPPAPVAPAPVVLHPSMIELLDPVSYKLWLQTATTDELKNWELYLMRKAR